MKKNLRRWDRERDRHRKSGKPLIHLLETRVPTKWLAVDLETGDVWRFDEQGKPLIPLLETRVPTKPRRP